MKICLLVCLIVLVFTQNIGNVIPDNPVNVSYAECTAAKCTTKPGAVTIDGRSRWLHYMFNYDDCFIGAWDPRYCPDALTCAINCGYDGVNGPKEYKQIYGVVPVTNGIRLTYVTYNQGRQNVGSRLYFL